MIMMTSMLRMIIDVRYVLVTLCELLVFINSTGQISVVDHFSGHRPLKFNIENKLFEHNIINIFLSISCKILFWVLKRTVSVLLSTHNICFG